MSFTVIKTSDKKEWTEQLALLIQRHGETIIEENSISPDIPDESWEEKRRLAHAIKKAENKGQAPESGSDTPYIP